MVMPLGNLVLNSAPLNIKQLQGGLSFSMGMGDRRKL